MSDEYDESELREKWDILKNGWGWEYVVQTRDLSIDFIREFKDEFDDLHWDSIFLYQENLNQRQLKELVKSNYPHIGNLLQSQKDLSEYLQELCWESIRVKELK